MLRPNSFGARWRHLCKSIRIISEGQSKFTSQKAIAKDTEQLKSPKKRIDLSVSVGVPDDEVQIEEKWNKTTLKVHLSQIFVSQREYKFAKTKAKLEFIEEPMSKEMKKFQNCKF